MEYLHMPTLAACGKQSLAILITKEIDPLGFPRQVLDFQQKWRVAMCLLGEWGFAIFEGEKCAWRGEEKQGNIASGVIAFCAILGIFFSQSITKKKSFCYSFVFPVLSEALRANVSVRCT